MANILERKFVVIVFYLFSSLFVFGVWAGGTTSIYNSVNGDPRSKVSDLINGIAYKPFVERALLPMMTRSVDTIVPASLKSGISNWLLGIPRFQREIFRLGWEEQYLFQYLIAFVFVYLSLFGSMFVIRCLYTTLYQTSLALTNVIPMMAVLCLPVMFHAGTHYIYDFPAMFFFTTGLLFMVQRKWLLFYLVYALGCINKETTVLLIVAFVLIYYRSLNKPALFKHISMQLLIFAITKTVSMIFFSNNPGNNLEFHFFGNFYNLIFPYTLSTLFFFVLFAILILYELEKKPFVLRQAFVLILPFVALTFTFGWIEETRDMYEIFPVVFLLLAHTIFFSIFKIPYSVKALPAQ